MNSVIAQLPRYALETLAIGGMLVVILYLLVTNADIRQALPIMGMFAFATYRLMPALQQLFAGITSIRFHTATLDLLVRDLTAPAVDDVPPSEDVAPPTLHEAVELRRVTFAYPEADAPVVEDLDLRVAKGEFVALVGTTGSGKTTIVDLIVGLLQAESGGLYVDGREVGGPAVKQWQALVGYVPQTIFLNDESLANNIAFGVPESEIDFDRVRRVADIARLDDFVTSLPNGFATPVGDRGVRLSGGQRQRIGIARALYRDPPLLVLDEATNALDEGTQEAILEAIRASDPERTIIMVTHRMPALHHCDRIFEIEAGRIVATRRTTRRRGRRA